VSNSYFLDWDRAIFLLKKFLIIKGSSNLRFKIILKVGGPFWERLSIFILGKNWQGGLRKGGSNSYSKPFLLFIP